MGFALQLSPPPRSIGLLKIRQIADADPDSDHFDPFDMAKNLKFHCIPVPLGNLTQLLQGSCAFVSLSPMVPNSLKAVR